MTLDQIIAAEAVAGRALRAVRPFMERGADRDSATRAEFIFGEVRHYAVCWDAIRTREDAKEIDAAQATKERQEIILRLTTSVSPARP